MSKVTDLEKAIKELQKERRKVDEIKKRLISIKEKQVAIALDWSYSYPPAKGNWNLGKKMVLDEIYSGLRGIFRDLKKLRKAQNYPIKKILEILGSIEKERKVERKRYNDNLKESWNMPPNTSPIFPLRTDIRIQLIIERRNKALERLLNSLLILIKQKRDEIVSRKGGESYIIEQVTNILIPTIHHIMAELDAETEQLNLEISSLSLQIDVLKKEA